MPNIRDILPTARYTHRLVLLLIVIAATAYKIAAFERSPRFDPLDETCQYWTESAFHYRHARMVADGGVIPALDRSVQFPEGVETYKHLTIGMEYPPGLLYRIVHLIAPGLSFHRWLIWFICAFSSLSIIAAFLAARAAWGSGIAGIVASAAYALSPFSFNRLVGNYGREDFALPILFLSFAAFAESLRGGSGRRRNGLLAAVLLVLGLAVWHVSRFHALFFFVLLAPVALFLVEDRAALAKTLRAFVVFLAVAGVVLPPLQEKVFLLSPAFIAAAALLLTVEIARARALTGRRALILFAAIFIPAAIIAGRVSPAEKEYSHVTGLAVEKLRHLGKKPADPAELPYDARVLWVEAFESPQAASMLIPLSTLAIWAPLALALGIARGVRGRLNAAQALALLLALAYVAQYVFLERFSPFFIFFLALLLPVLLTIRPAARRAIVIALIASAAYESWYDIRFDRPNPWRSFVLAQFPPKAPEQIPNFGNNERVVRWIRRHTAEDAVILTWYPTGPMIAAYTGRRINLHSKFESSVLRNKERRMIEALYASEAEFYALCREFGSDYFLYQANLLLDASTSSSRYMADRLELPTTTAAYRFHFQPDALRNFTLVYQDSFYRLYRVHPDGEIVVPPHPVPYEEMFDPALVGAPGAEFDDRQTAPLLARFTSRLVKMKQAADLYRRAGKRPAERTEVETLARGVLRISPDCSDALAQLALIASDTDRPEEARFLLSRALTTHPEAPELHMIRGVLLEREGRANDARAAYEDALAIAPGFAPARDRLAKSRGR